MKSHLLRKREKQLRRAAGWPRLKGAILIKIPVCFNILVADHYQLRELYRIWVKNNT